MIFHSTSASLNALRSIKKARFFIRNAIDKSVLVSIKKTTLFCGGSIWEIIACSGSAASD